MSDRTTPDTQMTAADKKRSAAALAETQRLQADKEAARTADPDEPTGPHLKTGYGLTAG